MTREVIALSLRELQHNGVVLRSDLAGALPPVAGDRVQLQQVVLNLLLNASEAMSGIDDRQRDVIVSTEHESGDRVRLNVRDTGVGLDPQIKDKLFDAFYTTKADGMGIGLAVKPIHHREPSRASVGRSEQRSGGDVLVHHSLYTGRVMAGHDGIEGLPGSYGQAPNGYRLPGATRLGPVRLQVSDLERSMTFYKNENARVPGRGTDRPALLGVQGSDAPLVELHARPGATPAPRRGRLGLYHFAILLPDRASLGRFVRHLWEIDARAGAADHLVSEAFYLQDPDNLGIEVYADRPRERGGGWRRADDGDRRDRRRRSGHGGRQ